MLGCHFFVGEYCCRKMFQNLINSIMYSIKPFVLNILLGEMFEVQLFICSVHVLSDECHVEQPVRGTENGGWVDQFELPHFLCLEITSSASLSHALLCQHARYVAGRVQAASISCGLLCYLYLANSNSCKTHHPPPNPPTHPPTHPHTHV